MLGGVYISIAFLIVSSYPLTVGNCIHRRSNRVGESIGPAEGNLRNAISPAPANV